MLFQKTREKAFWIYDKLRDGKVGNHFEDISSILDEWDVDSKRKVEKYLMDLLTHAVETTPYYAKLDSHSDISAFPIVNKNLIRDNYEQFVSKAFKKGELQPAVTSGSTGTPFKVLHNRNKVYRNSADTLYFAKLAGYELGQRLYYLKIWNDENKKSKFTSFTQNIIPKNVLDQSDAFFEKFVRDLNKDKSAKSFLGYSSAFEALCKYLDKTGSKRVSSNVKSIITMSEALDSYTKNSLREYFGCEVVSRYSNIENGILAQQKRGGGQEFYLNSASYFFEVLQVNSDKPVPVGSPGRIVVTDLFNYGMPMIRYDTGDIGTLDLNDSGEFVLSKVEGRKMDMIYDTKKELVSSFVVTNNMWKYTDIKQYQFVQESSNSYYFKLNPKDKFNREEELINEFKTYLGENAKIRVEYVSEIPLLASGKRKKVVNKWTGTD
ncbi:hypothetical protein NC796_03870 [Aliifodinibius sp. S!AR15-10]|uniref:hypothetical protein n=1 Tax=Aliifodinibius sp. S!AR15-10 TaxID=2950437 RepID=UPI0028648716|nr:hypothetical protein [Aliifodinibius sp. S!AR15-10]MDR8390264.1 hypothetical protein [Aliifodinibius sp. S!AR15-10]